MVHVIKAVWALRPATESDGMAQQECSLSPGCCGPLVAVKNAPRSVGRSSTERLLTLFAEGQTPESSLAVGGGCMIRRWDLTRRSSCGRIQKCYNWIIMGVKFSSLSCGFQQPPPFQNCFEMHHKKSRVVEMEKHAWKKTLLSLVWVIWAFLSLHKFQFSSFVSFLWWNNMYQQPLHRCLLRRTPVSAALGNLVWIRADEKQRQTIPFHTTLLASFIAGFKRNTSPILTDYR